MIGHEAVAPDLGLGLVGCFAKQIDIECIVSVFKKDTTSPVSTLGNMVGMIGDNDTR
jgi:hypothetical protein